MHPPDDGLFPTTSWTLVARIKSKDENEAARALDEICTQYHYPLYCYLRRRGCDHHEAQDVLHDFMAKLLRHRALERLDAAHGRLRGYLATALGNHLSTRRRDASRRPALTHEFPLDFDAIRARYQADRFSDSESPDRVFERKWAVELLHHVLARLRNDYLRRNKKPLIDVLGPVVERGGSLRGEDVSGLAAAAGMAEPALRTALSRMLRDFREILREEVRLTVEHTDEVQDEIAYLMGLFGN